jgi:hypothetical protein
MLPLMALLLGQYIHRHGLRRLWLYGVASSSAVLAGALWWGLPYYAAHVSAGESATQLAAMAEEQTIPVVAYRDDWDAAGYCRGGRELTVFPHSDSDALLTFLRQQPRAMVLVRGRVDELRCLLPSDLAVVRTIPHGRVTALIIVRQNG